MNLHIHRIDVAVFLLAVFCVFLLSPWMERTMGNGVVFLVVAAYLAIMINPLVNCKKQERDTLFLIVIYLAILLLNKILKRSTASVAYHFVIVKYFLSYTCMIPIYNKLNKKHFYFLLTVALATMAVTMLQNYQIKLRWRHLYSIHLYNTSGIKAIINTQYTGAILFVSGALLCGFLHAKSIAVKSFMLAMTVACVAFNMVVTQRGIILLLTIFMFSLLFLFNTKVRTAKYQTLLFLLICFIALFAFEYDKILIWLGNATGSARLSARLNSIITLLEADDINEIEGRGSLFARLRLTGVSIQTFFSSPGRFLFGVGHKMDTNLLVGNHSQFFDEFARWGIFGGTFSFILLLRMLKSSIVFSEIEKNTIFYRQIIVIIISIIIRSFVGAVIDESIGTAIYIVVPLFFRLLQIEKK